jgi:hypothetical protein
MVLDDFYLIPEVVEIIYYDFLVLQFKHFGVFLFKLDHFLADLPDCLEEVLLVGFSEGCFEEFDDFEVAVLEVERVLEAESEVEQFLLGEAGEGVEDLDERVVELVN